MAVDEGSQKFKGKDRTEMRPENFSITSTYPLSLVRACTHYSCTLGWQ